MECLKLYDKQEDGTMLLAELEHSLKALGEFLSFFPFYVRPQVVEWRNILFLYSHFFHTLKCSGERLSDDEVNELFADCMDPEDDEGNIFYARTYSKLIYVHIP